MKGVLLISLLLLLIILSLGYTGEKAEYLVYIIWDAFRYDYYIWANQSPYLGTPVINELLKNGVLFTNVYTGIPSITNPMQATLVTGAWPRTTGNIYRYYDKDLNIIKQMGRDNLAETLAEAAARQELKVASVQQFMVLDRGTSYTDPSHLYIQPGGDFQNRVNEAIKIWTGKPIDAAGARITFDGKPDLMFIYADDLDGIGHNEAPTYGLPCASTEEERIANCVKRLIQMDKWLGTLIQTLKDLGIYEKTNFVIASDHGMTPYSGYSSLPQLVNTLKDALKDLGYSVTNNSIQVLSTNQSPAPDNKLVIVTVGLQAQIYFNKNWMYTQEEYNTVVNALKSQEYIGGVYTISDLSLRGAHPKTADILVWPKPSNHFKTDITKNYVARGQHDSVDDSSQHVFLLMSGPSFKKGVRIENRVYIVDIVPTISKVLNIEPPRNVEGRVITEALK
ncbi:MAG: alkaline phosphatase family protein [Dictyoglomaceae bacterium]